MAVWTATDLRNRVLERLNIKAKSQPATAEDALVVDDAYVSIYDQLRKLELMPFAIGAIPDWAQLPLVKYVAGQVAGEFGYRGARLQDKVLEAGSGLKELQQQNAGEKQPVPITAKYY